MSTHEFDNQKRPDNEFINGNISFLVEGNRCRLLDGRRTNGFIENYDNDSAMFRWRITKYEDKGQYWDLPAEAINKFQFEKNSDQLNKTEIRNIEEKIKEFETPLIIEVNEHQKMETEAEIKEKEKIIIKWLRENSLFIRSNQKLDFSSQEGSKYLAKDLDEYMKINGLFDIEKKTADNIVLNPNSGEWVKGMAIMLGELGLVSYNGKIPRTKDIFTGLGSKENRNKYLINRLAFIRAYFSILNIKKVVLYRGMSTENNWKEVQRTFLSCTFNYDVAKDFSNFSNESKYINSYIIKMTCSVKQLFMTYLESKAFNRQYNEAEALILYNNKISI